MYLVGSDAALSIAEASLFVIMQGFELKRRGELKLIKVFQSEVSICAHALLRAATAHRNLCYGYQMCLTTDCLLQHMPYLLPSM